MVRGSLSSLPLLVVLFVWEALILGRMFFGIRKNRKGIRISGLLLLLSTLCIEMATPLTERTIFRLICAVIALMTLLFITFGAKKNSNVISANTAQISGKSSVLSAVLPFQCTMWIAAKASRKFESPCDFYECRKTFCPKSKLPRQIKQPAKAAAKCAPQPDHCCMLNTDARVLSPFPLMSLAAVLRN